MTPQGSKNLEEAISTATVGKHGSRPLTKDLIKKCAFDIQAKKSTLVQEAVLFAGLLQQNQKEILQSLWPNLFNEQNCFEYQRAFSYFHVPKELASLFEELITFRPLPKESATKLARFLFTASSTPQGNPARALAASILRIRYATKEEYAILYDKYMQTFPQAFHKAKNPNKNILIISEPFDGVTHSHLVSLALKPFFQKKGFSPLYLCADSSGPKYGINVKTLAVELKENFVDSLESIDEANFLDLANFSQEYAAWILLRQEMKKRPFLATLEKITRPLESSALITSAFHGPFLEKTVAIAEHAGYSFIAVIRKGREGTLTLSTAKESEAIVSAKQRDGSYVQETLTFPALRDGKDPRLNITLKEEVNIIKQAVNNKKIDDSVFVKQWQHTKAALEKIMGIWQKLSPLPDSNRPPLHYE